MSDYLNIELKNYKNGARFTLFVDSIVRDELQATTLENCIYTNFSKIKFDIPLTEGEYIDIEINKITIIDCIIVRLPNSFKNNTFDYKVLVLNKQTKNYNNDIANNLQKINSNTSSIASNLQKITTNAINIASNLQKINTNTSNIESNKQKANTNTSNIASNEQKINTNTSNIASNLQKINTNTSNIESNEQKINSNTGNIVSNLQKINKNIADITNLKKVTSIAGVLELQTKVNNIEQWIASMEQWKGAMEQEIGGLQNMFGQINQEFMGRLDQHHQWTVGELARINARIDSYHSQGGGSGQID